jgi:hypothetical protein
MTRHSWRDGDLALCGASLVQIAALDEGRALVVGGGQFGPWSIWMEASKLERVEERGVGASRATRPKQDQPGVPISPAAFPPARSASLLRSLA